MRMMKEMKEMRVCVLFSSWQSSFCLWGRGPDRPVKRIEVGDDDFEVKARMSENCVD